MIPATELGIDGEQNVLAPVVRWQQPPAAIRVCYGALAFCPFLGNQLRGELRLDVGGHFRQRGVARGQCFIEDRFVPGEDRIEIGILRHI
jgi:hypothetical protein